ncbi:retrotransposon protein, putative, ty1-copia subclass [Tanacetum coccineum]|uniref:Retrotransposon protein, putative, ty1-copia subclass n=1 Tax=Tanacetum coccineum TaxID=301880 RepID=A0ABQ5F2F4_9ASTR
MEVEDDEVGDLGEPANYKTAMLDPDKVIWQGAMDEEMKSMKVNKVWIVIDRPPNAKVVRNEDIYMEQPEGYVDPNYPNGVCKLQRAIYGLKQASRQWNKRFDEEIKKLDLFRICHKARCGVCSKLGLVDINIIQESSTGFSVMRPAMHNDDTKSQTGLCLYRQWRAEIESKKQTTIAMHATNLSTMADQKLQWILLDRNFWRSWSDSFK